MSKNNKTTRIIIPCSENEKKLITAAANRAGLPTATWVRWLIRGALEKIKKEV